MSFLKRKQKTRQNKSCLILEIVKKNWKIATTDQNTDFVSMNYWPTNKKKHYGRCRENNWLWRKKKKLRILEYIIDFRNVVVNLYRKHYWTSLNQNIFVSKNNENKNKLTLFLFWKTKKKIFQIYFILEFVERNCKSSITDQIVTM